MSREFDFYDEPESPSGDLDSLFDDALRQRGATRDTPAVAYADLETLFNDAWITGILYPVKSGKEATVYCCRAHPRTGARLLALKVYHQVDVRSFRNDALYREGRFRRETHELRAMRKKTAKGREFEHATWIGHEYATLQTLRAAGADVPRPFATTGSSILMEYIGDEETAAQPLRSVSLGPDEARRLFARALHNVELMLACDLVHGDLSAFNILYWQGRMSIIDFPQAVDPRFNGNAYMLLQRDVENLCRYFSRGGVTADPARIAGRLWDRFRNADL